MLKDYVKSVTARNKNLVTVSNVSKNGTFKLTAKNRSGKTYVDINLKSGVSVAVMITVLHHKPEIHPHLQRKNSNSETSS